MENKFKKDDRVKIINGSSVTGQIFSDNERREKWNSTNRIGFVVDVITAPAQNKIVKVGLYPDDPAPDWFSPGDLRHLEPGEGMLYLVVKKSVSPHVPAAICTSKEVAEQMLSENTQWIAVPFNTRIAR